MAGSREYTAFRPRRCASCARSSAHRIEQHAIQELRLGAPCELSKAFVARPGRRIQRRLRVHQPVHDVRWRRARAQVATHALGQREPLCLVGRKTQDRPSAAQQLDHLVVERLIAGQVTVHHRAPAQREHVGDEQITEHGHLARRREARRVLAHELSVAGRIGETGRGPELRAAAHVATASMKRARLPASYVPPTSRIIGAVVSGATGSSVFSGAPLYTIVGSRANQLRVTPASYSELLVTACAG